jgi:streptomycin 6-kinase
VDGPGDRRFGGRPGAQGRVRFEGGEELDEAAGLRAWEGNGAVRLHAACDTGAAYGLLLERCLPGTPLRQVLPEPDQDVVVAALLRRLWDDPREGIALFRELLGTAASRALLCTDLHGDNILSARRAVAGDRPQAVGDPAYDVLQHMLNCEERLAADPAGLAGRMARLAGLDLGRVRLWLFARAVQESVGAPILHQVARQLAPG